MKNFSKQTPAVVETTPKMSAKVRTVRLSRQAGGIGGMTLNTTKLAAVAFGQEFIHELKKPLTEEEYAQIMA